MVGATPIHLLKHSYSSGSKCSQRHFRLGVPLNEMQYEANINIFCTLEPFGWVKTTMNVLQLSQVFKIRELVTELKDVGSTLGI